LHSPTLPCSDMSNSLSQEWTLHHATSYSRRFWVCWWRSRERFYIGFSTIGWRGRAG
jgi:hypothetical protein